MGDIQSEEGRDIVLEMELPALPSGSSCAEEVTIVSAQLSYFNIITSQLDTVTCELKTNRTGNSDSYAAVVICLPHNY